MAVDLRIRSRSICSEHPNLPEIAIGYTLALAFYRRCKTRNFASDASSSKGFAPQEAEVDRLYSRFPAGSVGLALLLLRVVAGLGLVGGGIHLFTPPETSSESASVLMLGLVLVASAILLILGLRTSLAGSAAAICTVGAVLESRHNLNLPGSEMYAWAFLFALVFFLSGALALLGPGGYSLDARLSGWRMIKLSSRHSTSEDAD
jgi:uncharacterized membrane protein YphA (DoxX/SURF4 family)